MQTPATFLPPHGPYRPIPTGADGLPVESRERRLALRLMVLGVPQSRHGFDPSDLVGNAFKSDADRLAAWGVMLALTASGRVVEDGLAVFKDNPAWVPGEALANFEASVRGIGGRLGTTASGKDKASALFARIRTIYGAHCRTVAGGSCLVVPTAIAFRGGVPECVRALVVYRDSRGVELLEADATAFETSYVDPDGVRAPDPERCRPWPDEAMLSAFLGASISPFTSVGNEFAMKAGKLARDALRSVRPLADEAAAAIGDDITPAAWKSFMTSLLRAGNLTRLIKARGFANLDPTVRAAAMRDPLASFTFYNWMCGPDEVTGLRRRQASAVVPALSKRLYAIERTIDAGEPLMPALSELTLLPVPVLRRISGLTWQRLGRHYTAVLDGNRHDGLTALLAATPLHLLPHSRKDWGLAVEASQALRDCIGYDIPTCVALAASRDRGAFAEAVSKGALHAVSSTAETLAKAASGYWHDWRTVDDTKDAARMLLSRLCGSEGGLKRLLAFNAAWHRHQPWITANIANIRRRLVGEAPVRWLPLSKGDFAHAGGYLTWLCDDDALAIEGATMQHCVGSYVSSCARGESHIASITGADGMRSTAEFRVSGNGSIEVNQHRTYDNGVPTPACHEVLVGFVKAANARRGVRLNLRGIAKARKGFKAGPTHPGTVKLPDADAEAMVRLFDPCLGRLGRGKVVSDWREAIRLEMVDRPQHEEARLAEEMNGGAQRVVVAFL